MSAPQQYLLLLGLAVGAVGLALSLYAIARSLGRTREEEAKDVPAAAGERSSEPVWVRYHVRYYARTTRGRQAAQGPSNKPRLRPRRVANNTPIRPDGRVASPRPRRSVA